MDLDLAAGFVTILAIGLFAGVLVDRVAGPSWLGQMASAVRTYVTSVLIGIAGAFIGFHSGSVLGFSPYTLLAWAGVGAILALSGWRMVR
jgi:hypothetical protein